MHSREFPNPGAMCPNKLTMPMLAISLLESYFVVLTTEKLTFGILNRLER